MFTQQLYNHLARHRWRVSVTSMPVGTAGVVAAAAVAVAAYFVLVDTHGIHRVPHAAPRAVPLEVTAFAPGEVNNYLAVHTRVHAAGAVPGQETVVAAPDGTLWVFDETGWLQRVSVEGEGGAQRVLYVGGRVLGAAFSRNGSVLYACDVGKGLIGVDIGARRVEVLAAASDDGVPVLYCDDVDVDPTTGVVYFTDAMAMAPVRTARGKWSTMQLAMVDFFRGAGDGRLLAYDPASRAVTVLLSRLYFANGVAVARDGSYVLVAETFNARILRYWLTGPRAGSSEIFALLPAMPDGISAAPDGSGYWAACPTLVSRTAALAAANPLLRRIIGSLRPPYWPSSPAYGLAIKLDRRGDVVASLHDPTGATVSFISAVTQVGDTLYFGQLHGASVPSVRLPPALAPVPTSA